MLKFCWSVLIQSQSSPDQFCLFIGRGIRPADFETFNGQVLWNFEWHIYRKIVTSLAAFKKIRFVEADENDIRQ